MFRVNFDVYGMPINEWVEMDHYRPNYSTVTGKDIQPGTGRHAVIDLKELEGYEMARNEKNTVQSTKWAMNCFTSWCKETGRSVDLKTVTQEELNTILREFYGTVLRVPQVWAE